jgi:ech hydrogenase subunit D
MMEKETQSVIAIDRGSLLVEVDALRSAGWRLVQILCIGKAEGVELSYSFGLDLELRHLRLEAADDATLPSITSLYPGAFLYENEIRDLFGVRIERIRADWNGKVYDVAGGEEGRTEGRGPFSKVTIKATSSEEAGR